MNVNKRIVFFRMFFSLSIWFSRIHCLRREANIVMDANGCYRRRVLKPRSSLSIVGFRVLAGFGMSVECFSLSVKYYTYKLQQYGVPLQDPLTRKDLHFILLRTSCSCSPALPCFVDTVTDLEYAKATG